MSFHTLFRAGRRPLLALVILVILGVPARRADAGNQPTTTLEIAFHVVTDGGQPVVDQDFIDQRLARANQIFAPHGVAFVRQALGSLPADHAVIADRRARNALTARVSPAGRGVIDCFVVRALQDLGEPQRPRRGVHWHSGTRRGTHFIILSSISDTDVLAHELGHFFGNPQHSQVPGNLMSYQRGPEMPVLDARQADNLRRALRAYLHRRQLRPQVAVR